MTTSTAIEHVVIACKNNLPVAAHVREILTMTLPDGSTRDQNLDARPLSPTDRDALLEVIGINALITIETLTAQLATATEAQQQAEQAMNTAIAEREALQAQLAALAPATDNNGFPVAISALQGLLFLDQVGLSQYYQAWAASPERTFAERAFIDKATTWRRDNGTLVSAAAAMGIAEDQLPAMFAQAAQIQV